VSKRQLKVFLCHSSGDKPAVHGLYNRLRSAADYISPWLDEEDLLPGQRWEDEIPVAVRNCDVVLVCLSNESINKSGYVQKEIKVALDAADRQPEGTIFLIPVKLEECEIPNRLSHLHYVNLFEDRGFQRLMRAIESRAEKLKINVADRKQSKRTRSPHEFSDWMHELEHNKQTDYLEVVSSPSFIAEYPLSLSPSEFVDKLIAKFGKSLTRSEHAQLIAMLGAGDVAGRASVLRSIDMKHS
jgi:hypothetical protein